MSAWVLPDHIADVLPSEARHIEELRRDLPMVDNRVDAQADVMSVPTDPQSVFEAIEKHRMDNEPEGDHDF